MSDEIRLDGVGVSSTVLETIVMLAAQTVEGVASVGGGQKLAGLVKKGASHPVVVTLDDEGALSATVRLTIEYPRPLKQVAESVRLAVTEALSSQTGQPVASVDVFVDGVTFDE
ncbi:MAG: Asp23/Gls24 family envelope stress response protein [Coriobacteriia bacterium]